jgi:hypothetical protein
LELVKKRFGLIRLLGFAVVLGIVGVVLFLFAGYPSFQTAPYPLPQSPMVVYRLGGRPDPTELDEKRKPIFHGYVIEQQQSVGDPQLQQVAAEILRSRLIYGMDDIRCFEPGFAIRFGDGPELVDALICLDCQHVYFYRGANLKTRSLNAPGVARLTKLYARFFPRADTRATIP